MKKLFKAKSIYEIKFFAWYILIDFTCKKSIVVFSKFPVIY